MDRAQVLAILNELLTDEQNSLALRLLESTISVSSTSVKVWLLVQRMAEAARDHAPGLARLILELGGTPAPRCYPIATADLHFQDLQFVVQRLVADQEAVARRYILAAQRLSDEPRAAALVSRILQRHQQDLQSLKKLSLATV